jgi:hypothetical protein
MEEPVGIVAHADAGQTECSAAENRHLSTTRNARRGVVHFWQVVRTLVMAFF